MTHAPRPRRVTIEIRAMSPGDVRWVLLGHDGRRVTTTAAWRDGMPAANIHNALHEAADAAAVLIWETEL